MKRWIDHLGREVDIKDEPQRIISLCPSLTETLFALGLQEQVVGRTRFCIHPAPQVLLKQNVGGTKQVHDEVIDQLQPDVIIAEKEENTAQMISELEKKYPVYVINVETVEMALQAIVDLGAITGREMQGIALAKRIEQTLAQAKIEGGLRCAYLIWKNPYMVAGKDTYLSSWLSYFGWENVCKVMNGRYPAVTLEELRLLNPQVIFLSSEPYPFSEVHRKELQQSIPGSQVVLIDGEISWYGVHMEQAVKEMERVRQMVQKGEELLDLHTRETLQTALLHWNMMKTSDDDDATEDADRFQTDFYRFIDAFSTWWKATPNRTAMEEEARAMPEVQWIADRLPVELWIPFEGELRELVEGREREGDHTEQS